MRIIEYKGYKLCGFKCFSEEQNQEIIDNTKLMIDVTGRFNHSDSTDPEVIRKVRDLRNKK